MKITYITKLLISDTDKNKVLDMLRAYQNCWNQCSKVKFNIPKNSIVDLHNNFYKHFRETNNLPAQLVVRAEQSVLSTYRTIKSNKHNIKSPSILKKISLRLDKRCFSYKNEILSLITLEKRVKCQFHKYAKLMEYLNRYKFCDPLIFERKGQICISLTFDIPEVLPQNKSCIGVDLGIRVPAATSEGNLYISKSFNKKKRQIRYLKSKLQSKGTRSAKRHKKRIGKKEHNINKNFVHNLTKKILTSTKADIIVIEQLKFDKKKNKFKKSNKLSQALFGKIGEVLTYKAPIFGKTVIQVSPAFTSQIDSFTGKKDGIRKGRRYYSSSGKIFDADISAANNIALRANHSVSPFYGTYGQAKVTRLNV